MSLGKKRAHAEARPEGARKNKKPKIRASSKPANADAAQLPVAEKPAPGGNEATAAKQERKERHRNKHVVAGVDTKPGDSANQSPRTTPEPASPASKYNQTDALTSLPTSEISEYLASQQISIADPTASSPATLRLRPILRFDHLPPSALQSKSPFASFKCPTPIQAASWPFLLSGRDAIGVAETGSGKTLAFSLPCVELLSSEQRQPSKPAHPRALIVAPTRELAMQTHAAISPMASLVGLSAVCLFGGVSKDDQRRLLKRKNGSDIVVATPGRLKDLLGEASVSLACVQFLVLDEADRMLDSGFEDDIKAIIESCPAKEQRQTLMFTATWPIGVQALASSFMKSPVRITIGGRRLDDGLQGKGGGNAEITGPQNGNGAVELRANRRIAQTVEVVDPRQKEQRLLQLLREAQRGQAKSDRILVFCLYKKEAARVELFLQQRGLRVASIHGDLKQEQRTKSLEAFKSGTTTVLVATDVAARGLDIPEVKLVVNLTFPLTIEDYVHRIGRTGRAGKTGRAVTLFTEHDKAHSGSLINVLKAAGQLVPDELLKFGTTVKKKTHETYGAFFKDVDMNKKGTKITFD